MNTVSRRTVVSTIFSSALLGLVLPSRIKARTRAADQPHMQAALDSLKAAQRELHAADSDKGGHRVRAERLVSDAIAEVEKGIAFDRKH
jgi:hypothetical protein